MKKALSLLLVICLLFALTGCRRVMHGTDDLIEKARKIIPVADAENIEIAYAGIIGDDEDALIWFVSGNVIVTAAVYWGFNSMLLLR